MIAQVELKQLEERRRADAFTNAGSCAGCGKSLYGIPGGALDVLGKKYCDSKCALATRRKLQAEAAMQRLGKS
jgi:hypothetical protein